MERIESKLETGAALLQIADAEACRLQKARIHSDPKRRVRASRRTILRHWARWKAGGGVKVLQPRYRPAPRAGSVLFRRWFVRQAVSQCLPTGDLIQWVKSAWKMGKKIPGVPPRQGRENFPIHTASLYRMAPSQRISKIRELRRSAERLTRKADALAQQTIAAAAASGAPQ
jgi:hypothetical protein